MKIDINVSEVISIFKEIQKPEQLFAMIRTDLTQVRQIFYKNLFVSHDAS